MPQYEIHWKDFNSPLFRNEIFTEWPLLYPKLFKLPLIEFGIISRQNDISYYGNMISCGRLQKALMQRIEKNPELLNKYIKLSDVWAKRLNSCTAAIQCASLKKWTNAKLIKAYKKFYELDARQYAIGVMLVVLDSSFGKQSLDVKARSILKKYFSKQEFDFVYNVLTTPVEESFGRAQEREMLKIYARFGGNQSPKLDKAIEKHAKRWGWVYYVYNGPAWIASDFKQILDDWAERKVAAKKLLAEWNEEKKALMTKRKEIFLARNFTKQERVLLGLLARVVWAKPRRKDWQSKSYWQMENWFAEVASRLGITFAEARNMNKKMLEKALSIGKASKIEIQSAHHLHVCRAIKQVKTIYGQEALNFIKNVKVEKQSKPVNMLKGTPACLGKAKGRARIINSPADLPKMRDNDILVSVATTPSIISAMRKASAIVTDEGGLTCHAAIVSRELRIPCVVGVKAATTALKDGDLVEVDAKKGIIKKI